MIENLPNELTILYHSDKAEDRRARAFVDTVAGYKIKALDLKCDHVTETQLTEIANKMNVKIERLFDASYSNHAQSTGTSSLSDADLLSRLTQESILVKTPILIIGKRAYQYDSAYELPMNDLNQEEGTSTYGRPQNEGKIIF